MPFRRSQREIVDTYRGNLGYFRRAHYLRSFRLWLFLFAIAATAGTVAFVHWQGNETVFSTGPLSENHARFASDCAACHLDPRTNPPPPPLANDPIQAASASLLDRACLQCHALQQLHLPQATALTLEARSSELVIAHATDCALCHKEHVGPLRMPVPESSTCLTCHADADALQRSRKTLPLGHPATPPKAENLLFPDGLIHFIAPPSAEGKLPVFTATNTGHPAFGYQRHGVQDPAKVAYNHHRHESSDIPEVNGHKLNCADCHVVGPGGVNFQPIKYDQHCATCHSLQIQPSLPRLTIPHGDAEKVRFFLAGLSVSFEYAIRAEGLTDPVAISRRVDEEKKSLERRGIYGQKDLEDRVFHQGDPPDSQTDRRPRTGNRKFLTECAKCHTVGAGTATQAPKIEKPRIASRWLQKGRFTHEPHTHMACADCHGAVHASTKTTDILLPTQQSCAECHRPPAADAAPDLAGLMSPPVAGGGSPLAATQRATGGVRWGCVSCHSFHAPADAQAIIQSLLLPPTPAPKAPAPKTAAAAPIHP